MKPYKNMASFNKVSLKYQQKMSLSYICILNLLKSTLIKILTNFNLNFSFKSSLQKTYFIKKCLFLVTI